MHASCIKSRTRTRSLNNEEREQQKTRNSRSWPARWRTGGKTWSPCRGSEKSPIMTRPWRVGYTDVSRTQQRWWHNNRGASRSRRSELRATAYQNVDRSCLNSRFYHESITGADSCTQRGGSRDESSRDGRTRGIKGGERIRKQTRERARCMYAR